MTRLSCNFPTWMFYYQCPDLPMIVKFNLQLTKLILSTIKVFWNKHPKWCMIVKFNLQLIKLILSTIIKVFWNKHPKWCINTSKGQTSSLLERKKKKLIQLILLCLKLFYCQLRYSIKAQASMQPWLVLVSNNYLLNVLECVASVYCYK